MKILKKMKYNQKIDEHFETKNVNYNVDEILKNTKCNQKCDEHFEKKM